MILVDRAKPKTLEEMILSQRIKDVIRVMLNDPANKLTGMTLAGLPGTGKSTLARVIVNELKCACLWINASDDNSVDVIRSRVSDFCNAAVIDGQVKIVVLDEADCLTSRTGQGAGAQDVLRGLIEESQSDTRFILTCNYVNKIIPALLSRCPLVNLEYSPKDVMTRICQLVKREKIKISKKTAESFYENVVKKNFPRIRDILHILEKSINENNEVIEENFYISEVSSDIDNLAKEILSNLKLKSDNGCKQLSQFYMDNCEKFSEDYELLAQKMFWLLMDNPVAQIAIADYMNRMKNQFDAKMKEVQFYAMCLELKRIFSE